MNADDRRCPVCQGRGAGGLTTYLYERDGDVFVFEHVPAWICGQCGERSFARPVVEAIERLVRETPPPSRLLTARVYDLADSRLDVPTLPGAGGAPR